MNPRKITIKLLLQYGYRLDRHGSNHDIYARPGDGQKIVLKRHDFDEDDMRYICKEAGIPRRK